MSREAHVRFCESAAVKLRRATRPVAESTIGSIKAELFDCVPVDIHDVRHQLFEYIESFYNRHRLHSTLDYVTPNEKLQLAAAVKVA
jgi:transposase InsO family protein